MINTTTRPAARKTIASAIRATLGTTRSVVIDTRAKVGGYHALMAKHGLRMYSRKVRDGWAVWVTRDRRAKR